MSRLSTYHHGTADSFGWCSQAVLTENLAAASHKQHYTSCHFRCRGGVLDHKNISLFSLETRAWENHRSGVITRLSCLIVGSYYHYHRERLLPCGVAPAAQRIGDIALNAELRGSSNGRMETYIPPPITTNLTPGGRPHCCNLRWLSARRFGRVHAMRAVDQPSSARLYYRLRVLNVHAKKRERTGDSTPTTGDRGWHKTLRYVVVSELFGCVSKVPRLPRYTRYMDYSARLGSSLTIVIVRTPLPQCTRLGPNVVL